MLQHHKDSIQNMVKHYKENPEIKALFLIGSVATGDARPDSDIDGVAIVSQEHLDYRKINNLGCMEVYKGKCTYEAGYFDIHYKTQAEVEQLAVNGSEPMRNMFMNAQALFCENENLSKIVTSIPVFQKQEAEAKLLRYYCTFKQFYLYFWMCCKPEGFMRFHVASGMVFCLYRLILLENEILFPSMFKLEEFVNRAPNKPNGIIDECNNFMKSLSDTDCTALVETYENWTYYNYPKERHVINNNFANPYEWQ